MEARHAKPLLLLALLALTACSQLVQAEVVMVYNVNRHGARNVLPKTANLQETDSRGGPTLLPQGMHMCFMAGSAFRARYLIRSTCGATCLPSANNDTEYGLIQAGQQPGKGFHNYNTAVRSSALDRTLLSAQSFYAGVFPADPTLVTNDSYIPTGQQPVPVYSTPDENDWLIRAYTKCKTYDARLDAWYQSPEFQAKSQDTAGLRSAIAQLPGWTMSTDLKNWWNVFDSINVYRTYGVGNPTPPINDTTFQQVKDLANWLETAKMRPNLTGNLLGGPLVGDLMWNLRTSSQAVASGQAVYYKLLTVSSHYNAQLAMLSALGLQDYPPAAAAISWLSPTQPEIPQLAAVMVFELHAVVPPGAQAGAAPQFVVRLVAQPGSTAQYVTVPLPCAVQGDVAEQTVEAGACTLEAFSQLANPVAISTAPAWCSACANTDAPVCQLASATAQLASTSSTSSSSSDDHLGLAIGLSIGLTFLVTALLAAALAAVAFHRLKRKWYRADPQPSDAALKLSPSLSTTLSP